MGRPFVALECLVWARVLQTVNNTFEEAPGTSCSPGIYGSGPDHCLLISIASCLEVLKRRREAAQI